MLPRVVGLEPLCDRYGVRRLAIFGSATRGEFDQAKSDLDFSVEFVDVPGLSLARQYFDFKAELERLFDREVDLVETSAVPNSRLKRRIQGKAVEVFKSVQDDVQRAY